MNAENKNADAPKRLIYPLFVEADENGVYTITEPERTLDEVEAASQELGEVHYEPAADRWDRLPRSAGILRGGASELRVLLLGDSIINDTWRSRWESRLEAIYPDCAIRSVAIVANGRGGSWYCEEDRFEHYVLPHQPDLLVFGGVSLSDNPDVMRNVIRTIRDSCHADVLLMTEAFGYTNPYNDEEWSFEIPTEPGNKRAVLRDVSEELRTGFIDVFAIWGQTIRESGHPVEWFKRDRVHANKRGEQVLGGILARYLGVG